MKTAILVGIKMAEFDEMTPYEFMLHVETYLEQKIVQMEEQITLTWLGEYYHRLKRLPSLKEEIKKLTQQKQAMTDDQMLSVVKMLNSQFGGTVKTAEKEGS